MALFTFLRGIAKDRGWQRRDPRRTRRSYCVPAMETLEDRTLPSTFTVLNLNDGGPGSLRAGLASGDDTINFAKGLHGTITLTSGELSINNSVTINGPGADRIAVSGNGANRVFEVATGLNVTISGLTVTNGSAADTGGGILNDGSDLTLSGDALVQNVVVGTASAATSGGRGGGLYSASGTVTVTACQIAQNQALGGTSVGGLAIGGGVYLQTGTLTVSNSTVSSNVAHAADGNTIGVAQGGGLDVEAGSLVVNTTLIANNLAIAGNNNNNGGSGAYALGGNNGSGLTNNCRTSSQRSSRSIAEMRTSGDRAPATAYRVKRQLNGRHVAWRY